MKCALWIILFVCAVDCIRVPVEWPKPYKQNASLNSNNLNKSYREAKPNSVRTYSSAEMKRPRPVKYGPAPVKYIRYPSATAVVNNGGWIPLPPHRRTIVRKYKTPVKKYIQNTRIAPEGFNTYKPKKQSTYKVHGSSVAMSGEHELPQNVPTRPVYPGEGQWAKRGQKHRPYQRPENPSAGRYEQDKEEKRPEGYDTFLEGKVNFNIAKKEYERGFAALTTTQRPKKYTDTRPYASEVDEINEEEEEEFIPTKLYTQVRRTENAMHLPQDESDLRLREVVKDSRIQTVYTEEGYEDGAYDHAGHVKEAESDEGHRWKKHRNNNKGEESKLNLIEVKPYRKAQMVKDTTRSTLKNRENGESDMEVVSEIKVMNTPDHKNETHKFVKITPRKYKAPLVHKFAITEEPVVAAPEAHSLRKRSADVDEKYPYYKNDLKTLNENSPLRYSENMANIPEKKAGDMSFYESRAKLAECPEVEDSVDPVPDRIKNADEDGVDEGESGGAQRLHGLGDKIDCMKIKYFGENPLDSPLFKEDKIELAVPKEFASAANESEGKAPEAPSDDFYEDYEESASVENTTRVGKSADGNDTAEAITPQPLISNRRQTNFIRNPTKPTRFKPKRRLQHLHSEVQYKDEIKPSEQLHVLSDILRNIQNSTGELIQTPYPQSTHRSTQTKRNKHRRRRIKVAPGSALQLPPQYSTTPSYTPQDAEAILNTDLNLGEVENEQITYIRPPPVKTPGSQINYEEALLDSFGSETVAEESKPSQHVKQYPTVYKNHKESTEIYDGLLSDFKPEEMNPILGYAAENDIVGLVPPSKIDYKTIVMYPSASHAGHSGLHAGLLTHSAAASSLKPNSHGYFVPGMKPPRKYPAMTHLEYESNNLKRSSTFHRRSRRSPLKYTEIRQNTRKPFRFRGDVSATEGDDVEPQTTAPPRSRTTTSTTTTTTTEAVPTRSFLEFVADLKNSAGYVVIPDPTTTEKGATTSATPAPQTTPGTTAKPPDFLNFVAKLKSSDSYVYIPEKKPAASTTSKPEEEAAELDDEKLAAAVQAAEEDEEEIETGPVQNSRTPSTFSDASSAPTDGDYVPKAKSYLITSIDTSKYKTIDRSGSPMRLSSRYNSARDNIATGETNTVRMPILSASAEAISSSSSSSSESELELDDRDENTNNKPPKSVSTIATAVTEAEAEEEEPSSTSTSTTAATTTTTSARSIGKRRMWVRTQKQRISVSTTTQAPDVGGTSSSAPRRRIRTRIRPASTTESASEDSKQRKRSISNQHVPANHKPEYTPIIPRLNSRHLNNIYAASGKISRTGRKGSGSDSDYVPETAEMFTESQVKHVTLTTETPRYTDIVPKPIAYFTDPLLADRVNRLKENRDIALEYYLEDEGERIDSDGVEGDGDIDEEVARNLKNRLVINVPADVDHVSAISAMKSRSFQPKPSDNINRRNDKNTRDPDEKQIETVAPEAPSEQRLLSSSSSSSSHSHVPRIVKDPSKRLYYYAID